MVNGVQIKENEKVNKYLDLARELKIVNFEGVDDTNCSWCPWKGRQRSGKETGGTADQRKKTIEISVKISENA